MRRLGLLAVVIATSTACSEQPSPSTSTPLDDLEAETGRTWTVLAAGNDQLPIHVSGSRDGAAQPNGVKHATFDADAATIAFLDRNKPLFKMKKPRASLRLAKSELDSIGMTHARFHQIAHGIPVAGAELTAHYDPKGLITSLDSTVVAGVEDIDVEPTIDARTGSAIAKSDALAHQKDADESQLEAKEPSLVIYAREGREPRLAWKSTIRAVYGSDPHLWVTTVDAKTGAVLERFDNLQHVQGSGIGVLGDTKKIEVTAQGTGFLMTDTSRGVTITTHTSAKRQIGVGTGATVIKSTSATSWDATGVGKGAAVDAHFYAGVVYDHYKKVHGRNGIDGVGGAMLSSVHYGVEYQNSFWDGTSMSYGDGEGVGKAESAGLDVVAHEFTHGVTETTSGLEYLGQSGALNESVSDIFAVFIEHDAKPNDINNWILFEDVGNGFRDMKDPTKYDQPSNMSQFVNTQQDDGGVHINSGIPNNLMALMTVGGTNPASKINVSIGLGWEKSEKLWFRANTKYFQTRTSFAQAAAALMEAAKDIGLTENDLNIVDCATKAVGIVPGACKAIVDPNAKVPTPTEPTQTTPPTETPKGGGTGSGLPTGGTNGDGETATPDDGDTTTTRQESTGCNLGAQRSGSVGLSLLAALGLLVARRKRR